MKVYNEEKTEILETFDLEKGYLKEDKITIHINGVEAVEEVGHYETIREYENGGKDVEWVIDTPKVDGVEEHDEEEDIQVYIPYTEEEIKEREEQTKLVILKNELASTDYEALKYAEGYFTEEEYAPIKAKREALREQIREIIDKEN